MRPFTLTAALAVGLSSAAAAASFELLDPSGDDNGPGGYTYPTDAVYTKGSFDLKKVKVEDDGDDLKLTFELGAKIEDPWDSRAWGGNGFSVQMLFVFVDLDGDPTNGHREGLPGLNVGFAEGHGWDKALIVSPQGNPRVQAEVNGKAAALKADIVLPTSVRAQGTKLVARFAKAKLAPLDARWRIQVAVQSNEGFPDKTDLLTRKVNEFGGQHRFGGGNDYDCDPHVIDVLAGAARGKADEVKAQAAMLAYTCDASGNGEKAQLTLVPLAGR